MNYISLHFVVNGKSLEKRTALSELCEIPFRIRTIVQRQLKAGFLSV